MSGSRSKKSDPSYYAPGGEHDYRKKAGANLVGSPRTKEDEAMHEMAEVAKRGPMIIDKKGKKHKAVVGLSTKAIKVED